MIGSTLLAPRADGGWATRPAHDDYWYAPRGQPTVAGVEVTEELAMSYATIFACVNKLSKTLATLPVHVFLDLPDGRRQNMPKHPVRRMFNVRFNDEALAVPTRWAMMANLLLWGNAYFEVLRNQITGEPMAMRLLYSRYMTVERDAQTGRLVYKYREPGQPPVDLPPQRVLPISGLSFNGLVGLSVIGFMRETAALGIATTQYREAFLGNGAAPGIVIERPGDAPDLTGRAGENLVNDFDEKHKGSGKAFRTTLLREGMTLKTIGMSQVDAQFVELSRLTDQHICAGFDVQPPKVQDYSRATYDNLEQANMDWKVDSLIPWCVLTENAVNATLLDEPHYLKHNLDGLARGDIKSRHEAYWLGRQSGLYDTDECRAKEELEPLPNGEGKGDHWQPRNMVTKAQLAEESAQRDRANENAEATRQGVGDNAQTLAAVDAKLDQGAEQTAFDRNAANRRHAETAEAIAEIKEEAAQRDRVCETRARKYMETVGALKEQADEKRHAMLSSLLLDPATRAVTKETKAITGAFKRYSKNDSSESFHGWLDKFYSDHQGQLYEMFRVCVGYVAGHMAASAEAHRLLSEFCAADVEVSIAAIRDASLSSRSPDEVLQELDRWKTEKPEAMVRLLMGRLCGEDQTTGETEGTENE